MRRAMSICSSCVRAKPGLRLGRERRRDQNWPPTLAGAQARDVGLAAQARGARRSYATTSLGASLVLADAPTAGRCGRRTGSTDPGLSWHVQARGRRARRKPAGKGRRRETVGPRASTPAAGDYTVPASVAPPVPARSPTSNECQRVARGPWRNARSATGPRTARRRSVPHSPSIAPSRWRRC